jgi:hypothetical protein
VDKDSASLSLTDALVSAVVARRVSMNQRQSAHPLLGVDPVADNH